MEIEEFEEGVCRVLVRENNLAFYYDLNNTPFDLIAKKVKVYHISDKKPFIFGPLHTNPQDIAR